MMKWEGERKKRKKNSLHLAISIERSLKERGKVESKEKKERDRMMINGRWGGNKDEYNYLSASFFSALSFTATRCCCFCLLIELEGKEQ